MYIHKLLLCIVTQQATQVEDEYTCQVVRQPFTEDI